MFGKSFLFLLVLALLRLAPAQGQASDPPFLTREASVWADSVLKSLTYEQRIGQLFMVDAYSNKDSAHVAQIESLIRDYHIGGVIFFQGNPYKQAVMTNRFQSLSPVPLMIGIDGEWGLSMRLDSTVRFPRQMTLSAGSGDTLIYEVGREIGKQCRRMGIHINFAPVADVNNNPANPVINTRSFGDDPDDVAKRAGSFLNGMQSENVMGCLKHFPGHGDTDADSHLALPLISKSKEQLLETELKPFRKLFSLQPASVMVAHLFVPALDSTEGLASSLSPKVVSGLLESEMGFRGLVFTDALNMKGVADFYPPGEIALKALLAGNDILLFSADVPSAFWRIHYALQNCDIEQEAIDYKVKKILMAKYWSGLNNYQPIDLNDLTKELNNSTAGALAYEAYASAVTILKNESNYIPLQDVGPRRIASLVIGDTLNNRFQSTLGNYAFIDRYVLPRDFSSATAADMITKLSSSGYETVILSLHNILTKANVRYGITDTTVNLIDSLSRKVNLVTVVFGNSYGLLRLKPVLNSKSVLIAYEDTWNPHIAAAQVIMGGQTAGGVIPVTVNEDFRKGTGLCNSGKPQRLAFTWPEVSGIPSESFSRIDSIAAQVVSSGAAPGGQILVAWDGKIILQRPFGSFTGDSSRMVRNSDLYDIASVTKITATALAAMKLVEQKKLDVTKKASYYLPELKHSNKKNLIVADIMTHQAGLQAWIPFWKETMENGKPSYNIYHYEKDVNYSRMVADSLFILPSYEDKIWKTIVDSKVEKPGKYVYSDLGLFILQSIIEKVSGKPMDEYLEKEFYEPMGLYRLGFNPLNKFDVSEIAPTEMDTAFRKRLVWGTVHDPAAAMMGGVAGNAGLFSDAGSLAVIMQMLLNKGEYGGKRYLSAEVVQKFTSRYYTKGDNRRGLLFDKPEPAAGKDGPTARSASPATFGHTGFTGTCAWADPATGLVYIFLSNRVYPSASNNKLAKGNYRTDIMEEVYKVLKQYSK